MKRFLLFGFLAISAMACTKENVTPAPVKPIDSVKPVFHHVKINSIKVVDFPFVKSDATSWDVDGGPDLLYAFFEDGKNVLQSIPINDYTPSQLPLINNLAKSIEINNFETRYDVMLYDSDVNSYEVIGGFYFLMKDFPEYPKTVFLQNQESKVKIELSVEWFN